MSTPTKPKASRKGLTILAVLRIDGPLTVEEIDAAVDLGWCHCVNMCFALNYHGRVELTPDGRWDVTEEGRRVFAEWCDSSREFASARDRDAACRGMRV